MKQIGDKLTAIIGNLTIGGTIVMITKTNNQFTYFIDTSVGIMECKI